MTINERLKALREVMANNDIDAYLITSSDSHQSEYVAEHWKTRAWISGFTGSAGVVVVTQNHAGLWTDSRYFLQAAEELQTSEIVLHKQGVPHAPEHLDWIVETLPAGSVLGYDANQLSIAQLKKIKGKLSAKNIETKGKDLISDIWKTRPELPGDKIFPFSIAYAGKTRREKLIEVRKRMRGDYLVVSALDEIAWLFNMRGADVACNPVFYAYAIIGKEKVWLFINPIKLTEELSKLLSEEQVVLKPYSTADTFLAELPESAVIEYNPATTNVKLSVGAIDKQVINDGKHIAKLKAVKNKTEIKHLRHAMEKDGVALLKLYRWLENTLPTRSITEVEVAEQLRAFRAAQDDYFGESFDAIVGYRSNGAIVHYRATEETCATLSAEGILLLDSGGQYLNGTTDITRTTLLGGTATLTQKENYTAVLQGHIALDNITFPAGTNGMQLDTLARMHLWNLQRNYGHGTGHGVGFFLNVHEGPQGFAASATTSRGTTALVPGMVTSNEPGFYQPGEYGIRIENLVLSVQKTTNEYGDWLGFETLTLFPIDTALLLLEKLSEVEKEWLNTYHKKVYERLSPRLDTAETEWLRQKTQAI